MIRVLPADGEGLGRGDADALMLGFRGEGRRPPGLRQPKPEMNGLRRGAELEGPQDLAGQAASRPRFLAAGRRGSRKARTGGDEAGGDLRRQR